MEKVIEEPSEGFGFDVEMYLAGITSPNAKRFFKQVYSQDVATYLDRLDSIGFLGLERVLDAGCGFGQWSVALARNSGMVDAIDVDPERIMTLQKITSDLSIENLRAAVRSIDTIQPPEEYDGIFCYSSLYYSDYRESIRRLADSLAPGGLLYIQTNDLGWYVYNLLNSHNDSEDFSSRDFALSVIQNTLSFYSRGLRDPDLPIVNPIISILEHLQEAGLSILGHGRDGSVTVTGRRGTSFHDNEHLGLTSVFEVLCRKE